MDEIDMIQKMTVLIGAAACTGLVIIFVPGFAREIAAGVMPLSKIHLGVEDGGLDISPPDAACRTIRGRMDVTGGLQLGESKL